MNIIRNLELDNSDVCPQKFPVLKMHNGKKYHGDVCQKSETNKNFRCPKGCKKTKRGKSPYCQMSGSNPAPCRLVCQDGFPRLQTFSGPSPYGNVCKKQTNNNFRCPRGCRKTISGNVPYCSAKNDQAKPCRKP